MDMMKHCFGADAKSDFEWAMHFMEHYNRAIKLDAARPGSASISGSFWLLHSLVCAPVELHIAN